jgi:uncharacterized protein
MRQTFFYALLVIALAANYSVADEDKDRTITTAGEAVVYAEPDEVVFQFGVETRDQSLDQAESRNEQAAAKLVGAIKKLGVEDQQISTAQLNVQILYQENRDLLISGYSVNRAYSVCLKDPKKCQALVDMVLKNGGNRINGLEFRTKELRKYRDQARAMAIKASLEKAEALAGELKCKPGNPRNISETGSYWGYWGGSSYANTMSQNAAQVIPSGGEGADPQGLPLGQIAVRANVSVTFDLIAQ